MEDADEKVQLANQIYDLVSGHKTCGQLPKFILYGVLSILISTAAVLLVLLCHLHTDVLLVKKTFNILLTFKNFGFLGSKCK